MNDEPIEAQVDEILQGPEPKAQRQQSQSRQQSESHHTTSDPGTSPSMRTRISMFLLKFATHPKSRRFLKKSWWPLWLILGLIFGVLLILAGCLYLVYKGVVGLFQGPRRSPSR